jgi:hypothetical protein
VKTLILSISLFNFCVGFSQQYLNDTISVHGSDFTYFNSILEVDSGYFCVGMATDSMYPQIQQYLLGFIDHNGNWSEVLLDHDSLNIQKSAFSYGRMVQNNAGNFVHVYKNCDTISCYPRVKEVSPDGQVINDIRFNHLMDSMNLIVFDFNSIFYDSTTNNYSILMNVSDTTITNMGGAHGASNLYVETDENFNILDTLLIFDENEEFGYMWGNLVYKGENKIISFAAQRIMGSNINDQAKVVIYRIDEQGNLIRELDYQDGQHSGHPFGLTATESGGYVFTYTKGNWDGNSWYLHNYICKLDSNFNVVWTDRVDPDIQHTTSQYFMQYSIVLVDDGYVIGGGSTREDTYENRAQVTKYNIDGEQLWQRRIYKFPYVELETGTGICMLDILERSNGGYALGGYVNHYFNGNSSVKGYGYILETNCLGFMGAPEASAGYLIKDDFEVEFYNTSMQAGAFEWDFGDDTHLLTDEYTDTVSHVYSGYGNYEVMLIAHGCDGAADTIFFSINPAKHANPGVVTDGQGFFTVFPNPLLEGGNVYIYLNGLNPQEGDVFVQFVSMDGKMVENKKLLAEEGLYMLDGEFAKGEYYVNLYQGSDLLQSKKLLVD